jgi:hypothetical protein
MSVRCLEVCHSAASQSSFVVIVVAAVSQSSFVAAASQSSFVAAASQSSFVAAASQSSFVTIAAAGQHLLATTALISERHAVLVRHLQSKRRY